jgi:hypothetical protein
MFPAAFLPIGQVPATANRLERAAGELRERAGSRCAVPSLPVTLDHVEDALDQLAASMRLMAEAAVEWSAQNGETTDEDVLPAETRALAWHLRRVADALTESRDACPAAGEWASRLLAQTHQGAPMIMQRDQPCAHAHGTGSRSAATVEHTPAAVA